jgi:hypothetical protein
MHVNDRPEVRVDARIDDSPRTWHAPQLTALGRLDSLTTLGGGSPQTDGGTGTTCMAGAIPGDCGTI